MLSELRASFLMSCRAFAAQVKPFQFVSTFRKVVGSQVVPMAGGLHRAPERSTRGLFTTTGGLRRSRRHHLPDVRAAERGWARVHAAGERALLPWLPSVARHSAPCRHASCIGPLWQDAEECWSTLISALAARMQLPSGSEASDLPSAPGVRSRALGDRCVLTFLPHQALRCRAWRRCGTILATCSLASRWSLPTVACAVTIQPTCCV